MLLFQAQIEVEDLCSFFVFHFLTKGYYPPLVNSTNEIFLLFTKLFSTFSVNHFTSKLLKPSQL